MNIQFAIIINTFLAVVFILSGISKMFNLKSFRETLTQLRIGRNLSSVIAICLPICEIITCILIIIPKTQFVGLISVFFLSGSFLWATWRARGRSVECNCFGGVVSEHFGRITYYKILLLIALDLLIITMFSSPIAVYRLSFLEIVSALFTSGGVILVYSLLILLDRYGKLYKEIK